MKMYVDENQRYNDTKSTGYSFVLVGFVGIVLIVLLWLGVLPVNIPKSNMIMITVVMGIMFAIFLGVGINSFLSLNKIKDNAQKQDQNQVDATAWFIDTYKVHMLEKFGSNQDDEESYFSRYDFIFNKIKEKYDGFSEEVIDHISEEIYNKIYGDKE